MKKQLSTALAATLAITYGLSGELKAEELAGLDKITFTSEDGKNELSLGGRIHYDFVNFDDDATPFVDNDRLRRARLSLSGKFADDWRFRVERDIGGTSQGWKSVWLGYDGVKNWNFRVGNMVTPLGFEQQMGSNDFPLMERSLASALTPGLLTGVQAHYDRKGWTASLGYFGNPIDEEIGNANNDGKSIIGRVTFAPLRKKNQILHFGASFERRAIDTGAPFRIRTRPGSGLTDQTLVSTGFITGVDNTTTVGLEAAASFGPVSFMAENLSMRINSDFAPSVKLNGWQATGAWIITGEKRRYNSSTGTFGGIIPKNKWGAVEFAVRYDELDLQDGFVTGGREKNLIYDANWYVGKNFRVMLSHLRAQASPNRSGIDEKLNINQLRLQFDF